MAQPQTVQVSVIAKPDLTRRKKAYRYAIQLADPGAPTYPAGGIVVNLSYSNVLNPLAEPRGKWSSPALPKNIDIDQISPLASGYNLTLEQAAANPTMSNFVLRIWTAPGTELGTGSAIPAALFAAAIANSPQLIFDIRGANYIA
jgi:hypothetical protein